MKTLISFILSVVVAFLLVYYVDGALVSYIVDQIPKSASEWIGLIRIGVWILVLLLTGGIIIWISSILGIIVNAILGD
jgi:hypothetical protein